MIDFGFCEEKIAPAYVIITYSRKLSEYQKHVRRRQIEQARILLKSREPNAEEIPDVRRYIRKKDKNEETQEGSFVLDTEQIAKDEKVDGFYGIITNRILHDENGKLLHDEIVRILEIVDRRYRMEEFFRIPGAYLDMENVKKKDSIIPPLLICYTGFLVFRLLERLLDEKGNHFTIGQMISTLNALNVINVDDLFYMADYDGGEMLNALEFIAHLSLDKMYYQPKELNKIVRELLK
ncbi:MAG: hypothetical protein IJS94_00520 [Clostridia bacterium]|nr:hypothetical protein [Clostridia bacterium]